jgi:arylsulfatase A-like enzyme
VYRVPLLARWPGVVAPGASTDRLVSSMDLAATFLEVAEVAIPEPHRATLDSRSLVPLLRGRAPADWRTEWVSEFHGDEFGLCSTRMLVHDRHKFVLNPHDTDELYDLAADPAELCNLAGDREHAELRDDMESRLWRWMDRTEDPLRLWAYNYLG